MDYRLAKKRYNQQKAHCCKNGKKDRNGADVQMKLTFEEWADIWIKSGKWEERGIHKGSFCMMRKGDIGHYEKGNVVIGLNGQNTSDALLGRKHTDEHRRKNREAHLGQFRSEELRKKVGDFHRGRKRSEETKQKMRLAQLGKSVALETKLKLSALNKGRPMKRVKCEKCGMETSYQNLSRHIAKCNYGQVPFVEGN